MKKSLTTLLCAGVILSVFTACENKSKGITPTTTKAKTSLFDGKVSIVNVDGSSSVKLADKDFKLDDDLAKNISPLIKSYNKKSYQLALTGDVTIGQMDKTLEALLAQAKQEVNHDLLISHNKLNLKIYAALHKATRVVVVDGAMPELDPLPGGVTPKHFIKKIASKKDSLLIACSTKKMSFTSIQSPLADKLPPTIDIRIIPNGFIFHGRKYANLDKLQSVIQPYAASTMGEDTTVNIKDLQDVSVERLLQLTTLCKKIGLKNLNIFVQEKKVQ